MVGVRVKQEMLTLGTAPDLRLENMACWTENSKSIVPLKNVKMDQQGKSSKLSTESPDVDVE